MDAVLVDRPTDSVNGHEPLSRPRGRAFERDAAGAEIDLGARGVVGA